MAIAFLLGAFGALVAEVLKRRQQWSDILVFIRQKTQPYCYALLKRCTSKGYRGFESLPHRCFSDPIRTNPEAYWRAAYFFEGEAWRIFTNHRE
jgi:hypothetical protein